MAVPTTIRGTQVYIKVGLADGPPETFAHPCLINAERGVTFRSSSSDIIVPDCATPDDPAWRLVEKDTLSVGITGAGVVDNVLATIALYSSWHRGTATKNVQVWLGTVGFWGGAFALTEFSISGDRGDKARISLTLESNGIITNFAAV